jgi:EpsI family protein
LVLAAAAAGRGLRPSLVIDQKPASLDSLVPKKIGPWQLMPDPRIQVSLSTGEETTRDQPYDDQILRTYVDDQGHEIMLAVAYGSRQRQEVKIHRPELCYPAQGWQLKSIEPTTFDIANAQGPVIAGHRMVVRNGRLDEAVSYWIRIGSTYSSSAWRTRWVIIQEGMSGRMSDGVLVRLSQHLPADTAPDEAFARQADFARLMVHELSPEGRRLLAR